MEDVQVNNPQLWTTLAGIFGPGGLVLLLTNAAAGWFIKMQWARLKEKDDECHTEMVEAEARWETRFQQMRTDVKEGFAVVGKLTEQITTLVARARP